MTFFNDNNESIRNVGNETELFFYLRHGDVVLTQTAKCYQNMTTYLFVALKVHSMVSLSVETLWEKYNNIYEFILQNINEKYYLCHCWVVFIFNMYLQEMQV